MSLYKEDLKTMGTNVKAYVMKHQGPVVLLAEIRRVLDDATKKEVL
jgi:hypothetical protein